MKILILGNENPRKYLPGQLGDAPVPSEIQDAAPSETRVILSPDSSYVQVVSEVAAVWAIQSNNQAPTYIRYSPEAELDARLVADHFGINDRGEIQ